MKTRYSKQEIEEAIEGSKTRAEIIQKLGWKKSGSSYNTLAKIAESYGFILPDPAPTGGVVISNEEWFVIGVFRRNTSTKKRLVDIGYPNNCWWCKQPPLWNNEYLSLQLDHINGDNLDNRLENLRLLCPNCHSQTDTFSKNNKQTR